MIRYIVNRQGTKVWHEITADLLVDWAKQDSKEREKITKDWLKVARHGEIYLFEVNSIVALEVPDGLEREVQAVPETADAGGRTDDAKLF